MRVRSWNSIAVHKGSQNHVTFSVSSTPFHLVDISSSWNWAFLLAELGLSFFMPAIIRGIKRKRARFICGYLV